MRMMPHTTCVRGDLQSALNFAKERIKQASYKEKMRCIMRASLVKRVECYRHGRCEMEKVHVDITGTPCTEWCRTWFPGALRQRPTSSLSPHCCVKTSLRPRSMAGKRKGRQGVTPAIFMAWCQQHIRLGTPCLVHENARPQGVPNQFQRAWMCF